MGIGQAKIGSGRAWLLLAVLGLLFPSPAAAQIGDPDEGGAKLVATPAEKFAISPGGVDMRTGQYTYSDTDLSIGGLALTRITNAVPGHANPFGNISHNWDIMVTEKRVNLLENNYANGSGQDFQISVRFGGRSETFDAPFTSGFTQVSRGRFASLTYTGDKASAGVVYTFQAHDGTIAVFRPMGTGECSSLQRCAYVSEITEVDGTRLSFEYDSGARLRSVTSSRGHALLLENNGTFVNKACVINLSVMVKPASNDCPANAQATASYAYNGARLASVTDPGGSIWSFTYGPSGEMGHVKPGPAGLWLTNDLFTVFDMDGGTVEATVGQTFADGQTYSYTYDSPPEVQNVMPSIAGGSFVNALNHQTVVRFDFPVKPGTGPGDPCTEFPCPPTNFGSVVYQQTSGPVEIIDPLGRTTTSFYCDPNAWANLPPQYQHRCIVTTLQHFTDPEGIKTEITYDGWRNIQMVRRKAKPGSGLADIVTEAFYACANYKSCAKPNWVKDPNGNQTDYAYSLDHGGVLTETGPAVPTRQANGTIASVRPQKRYTYAQRFAWISNGSGGHSQAAAPIWLLTQQSSCRTSAAHSSGTGCTAANDEVVTAYDYGPDSGPNTLLLRGTTVTADGQTLRTCFTYDARGNKLSETLPGANLASCPATPPTAAAAHMTAYRYDAEGRLTGTIAPDPDGGGALKYAVVRNTYDAAGRLTKVEQGEIATWQSEAVAPASWTGLTILKTVDTVYDALDRKVKETVSGGTATPTVTQFSYDLAGRLECTAVRMNPAVYASLPASACNLGTQGAQGPDRITKNTYDAAGQLLKVTEAFGVTTDQADEKSLTYTLNGQLATLTDAMNNRTTWEYDDQDRRLKMRFPVAAQGAAASSTVDYEQYGYDANGNRTSFRKRDTSTLTYSYDPLNRMSVKVVPSRADLTAAQTRDVFYAYDLRNLQTDARFDSLAGEGLTSAYDGFGRLTSTTVALGGFTRSLANSQYDLNGNRRELTYPDTVKMSFAYDGLSRMTNVYEGAFGSTVSLGSIVYDNGGRRFSLTRRYGDKTDYTYDGISRLASLTETFVGAPGNTASTFGYNPASQVILATRSNDNYAWRDHYNVVRPYTTNGLNQYTVAGPLGFQYDPNGNLTQSGTSTYLYDIENRLVQAGGAASASMVYDPLGRLFQTSGGSAGPTQFLYDGDELVAEYDGVTGVLLRRYVHGAGVDDPLVWYDGAGLTQPRFLHTDHQGSITGIAGSAGALLAINAYDEYGIPAAANLGRFQYTGQAWISELGMYHYKARIYSPTLGRFMQTDPVGYEDQINLYAYVGNDPINNVDSSGEAGTAAGAAAGCALTGPACPAGAVVGAIVGTAVTVGVAACTASESCRGAVQEGVRWLKGLFSDSGGQGEELRNDNPYDGPVDDPVTVVDGDGNAIPVNRGEQVTGSPKGDYQQVRDSAGKPTGVRIDRGGHRNSSDPAARGPHAHRPGVTRPGGNPHLPMRPRREESPPREERDK